MAPSKFIINEPIPIRGGLNDRLSKPPIIEITQSMSQPADPDAPSFLTTLPAEIRNAVYAILFKQDEPIEIMDWGEQSRYPAWLEESDDFDEEEDELESAPYMERKTYDFHLGLNLLETCRQVYWEAARVLYGANAFCATFPEHRHNKESYFVKTAADFIQSIGTQVFLLSELSIDITRVCPPDCRDDVGMDVLPLVQTLWSRPSIVSRVSFTTGKLRSGFELHSSFELHSEQEYDDNKDICTTRLNQILRALCTTDQPVLRRCGRFERLISQIEVCNYYKSTEEQAQAHVLFKFPNGCWRAAFEIDQLSGNATLNFDSKRSLTMLPPSLYSRIMEYALFLCQNIDFNLHSKTFTGLERTILQLDRKSRNLARMFLERSSRVSLRMKTSEAETSFDDFRRLRKWWEGPYGLTFKGTYPSGPLTWPAPKISLYFDSPNATLASLRINVKYLIRVTYFMNKSTVVRIVQSSRKAGKCTEELYEIDIQTLRRRCFILLSAMLLSKPAYAKFPVPEIWIDGTANPLEVVWYVPEAGRVQRGPNHPLTAAALWTAGLDYIKTITSIHKITFQPWENKWCYPGRNDPLVHDDSIMSMWRCLRALDWKHND